MLQAILIVMENNITTYTITFTEHNCTTFLSGLSKEQSDRKIRGLLKQKIHFKLESKKRITGNIK